MLRQADAIICGTWEEAAEAQEFVRNCIAVIPNGIHAAQLDRAKLPDDADLLTAFPQITAWDTTVLFFGRVHPKKGLDLLVEAFLAVAERHPGLGLLIAGIAQDRAYEAALRSRIAASGHAARVVFTTVLTGPVARAVFRRADIFALPSHQEGFSIAILEAMALSTPILITRRCHLPEVERKWNAGLVVPDTAEGFRDGLARMLAMDPGRRKMMGLNGRRAVVENYDWDAIAARLEWLYRGSVVP